MSEKRYRRLDIQGLRGLAVVFVLTYHAGLPLPGGFIGVDIFFVISGYVITGMLIREYEATGNINFRNFYKARFLRLAPNLGLMISTVLLAVALLLPPLGWQQIAQKTGLASVFSMSNLVLPTLSGGYFDLSSSKNPFLHTWSLSVEEQFYLIFPILMLIALRSQFSEKPRGNRFFILYVLALISFFLCLILSLDEYSSDLSKLNYYSMPTRFWEFACGSLVVFSKDLVKTISTGLKKVFMGLACVMILCSGFLLSSKSEYPGMTTIFPVIGTCVLLGLNSQHFFMNKVLSTRLPVAIGNMSYSLYLWHWPAIVIAMAVWPAAPNIPLFATLISIVPAYLSYVFVERRIRNSSKIDSRTFIKILSVILIVPSFLASSTWVLASSYWKPKFSQTVSAAEIFTTINRSCHFDENFEKPEACRYNLNGVNTPVFLIGDSNAGHFGPGLEETTLLNNQPLVISTSASCPFLPVDLLINSQPQDWSCLTYHSEILKTLKKSKSSIVLISFSESYFTLNQYALRDASGRIYGSSEAKYSLLRESLTETLKLVQSFGHQIHVIQPVPHFVDDYQWNLRECLLVSLIQGCERLMPLSFTEEIQGPFKRVISEVAIKLKVSIHDFSKIICPEGSCATRDKLGWIYADSTHITNSYSLRLKYELLDVVS
jgi:peptidoglycan/LPS O-acetylase OafA/YrhL